MGDQVEYFRPPQTKDVSGWHGPATVTDVTALEHGQIAIRWQGRVLMVRTQDVRRALLYVTFLAHHPVRAPMEEVRYAAARLQSVHRLGWVRRTKARDGPSVETML